MTPVSRLAGGVRQRVLRCAMKSLFFPLFHRTDANLKHECSLCTSRLTPANSRPATVPKRKCRARNALSQCGQTRLCRPCAHPFARVIGRKLFFVKFHFRDQICGLRHRLIVSEASFAAVASTVRREYVALQVGRRPQPANALRINYDAFPGVR
jgi:hypothetical protein